MAQTLPRRRKVISRRGGALSFLAIATIAAAYTALPPLTGIAGRLTARHARRGSRSPALEALSALGFVLVFKLIFGARLGWRQGLGAGLRALGATTPAFQRGVVGPAVGARSSRGCRVPLARLTRSTVAFAVITVLPSLVAAGVLGLVLGLGILHGPHDALRTLTPAGLALVAIAGVWATGRRSASKPRSSASRPGWWEEPLSRSLNGAVRWDLRERAGR